MAVNIENYIPVVRYQGLNTAQNVDFSASSSVVFPAFTAGTITSTGSLIGGTQALSGAGAINLTTLTTKLTTTGANALTLANGTDGQVKIITMVSDGGDGTLTPTTKTGYSTITFNDAGDGCILVYTTTTGWMIVSNNGCTVA